MPTIDELPAAVSVSDTDELLISQSGNLLKATRGQILAGVQAALYLSPGTLLGRNSAGIGGPSAIAVGANLTLSQGALSGPAPFSISALAEAGPIDGGTLVPVGQGGQNAAVPYATFIGGIASIPGIDGSQLQVNVTGTVGDRRLGVILADAVSVESFGAVGDGVTDDSGAFGQAVASGRALRLDAKTYIVNAGLFSSASFVMLGIANATVVRRLQPISGSAWISLSGPSVTIHGVIFDAGSIASSDCPSVQVLSGCRSSSISECGFVNATGSNSGHGLSIYSSPAARHEIFQCTGYGNFLSGISATGGGSISICHSSFYDNGNSGIFLSDGWQGRLDDNTCSANQFGISAGSWSEGLPANGLGCTLHVSGNALLANALWGLAISGTASEVSENIVACPSFPIGAGGILARLISARLGSNLVAGGISGLDCRASSSLTVSGNQISGSNVGILAGGCQYCQIDGNFLSSNGWAISVSAIEPSISQVGTGPIAITANWIGFSSAQSGGVTVQDGPQGISVIDNVFNLWGNARSPQALWLHTDAATVKGNQFSSQSITLSNSQTIAGLISLVFSDVADSAFLGSSSGPIQALLSEHQVDTMGQIVFIRVSNAGYGYSTAQVDISGSGSGASAQAIIYQGQVHWIVVTNPGSGYGGIGAVANVTITGDGSGASATAYVGLPVLQGRQLTVFCNSNTRFSVAGSTPAQQNWTGFDVTIPANGTAEILGLYGRWLITQSPPIDYLTPTGNGGLIIGSVASGDITIQPATNGNLHISNQSEPNGYITSLGRGSPEGVVSAPPGSDFRNLDGGIGSTLWIKLTGTDSSGWQALA